MQEQKQHHHGRHLLNHHKEEEKAPVEAVVYSETAYGVNGAGQCYETTETVGFATTKPNYDKDRNAHQRKEHLGELGTVGAGPFAMYEKQQAKKDEVHKHRHQLEEEIGTVAAAGAGGYTFHEHQEKKESVR